jgi:hypothetical protein
MKVRRQASPLWVSNALGGHCLFPPVLNARRADHILSRALDGKGQYFVYTLRARREHDDSVEA